MQRKMVSDRSDAAGRGVIETQTHLCQQILLLLTSIYLMLLFCVVLLHFFGMNDFKQRERLGFATTVTLYCVMFKNQPRFCLSFVIHTHKRCFKVQIGAIGVMFRGGQAKTGLNPQKSMKGCDVFTSELQDAGPAGATGACALFILDPFKCIPLTLFSL